MKNYCIVFFFLMLSHFGISQTEKDDVKSLLETIVSKNQVMGVSAGYSVNEKIIDQAASGYANKKDNIKFDLDTRVRMGSIAKPMTALAIMQLVEQGKLDLDVPIQTYIPEYPKQKTTQITTRHLLSHTSGISGYKNASESNTTKEYTSLSRALDIFKNRDLLFEPGTQYSYTTYGYTVLGVIIENVSGLSFENYMQKNIWDKAQMTNTGVEKFKKSYANKSQLYNRNKGKGKAKLAKENNVSNRIPAGGFYTTVGDMLKFGNAVLNNIFVQERTFTIMREHHSLEKENNAYGFGWFLYSQKPNEGAIIGHPGAQIGCTSFLFIVPSKKTVSVILSNTSRAQSKIDPIANQLLNLALNAAK
ncbi:serine hydrolase domain-containing protein [Aquimarina litoralis]|uniref:serine hydrolase domain-containing protein n=1 Tax=Aquimarina litoralis TaxID=584605 RepID=UPI001C592187|nr:serine hydrolase domain-containing protein [Aquimarina litoralis]MBW1294774.1 serine hydrolase [Aquimarina litoralis]